MSAFGSSLAATTRTTHDAESPPTLLKCNTKFPSTCKNHQLYIFMIDIWYVHFMLTLSKNTTVQYLLQGADEGEGDQMMADIWSWS